VVRRPVEPLLHRLDRDTDYLELELLRLVEVCATASGIDENK